MHIGLLMAEIGFLLTAAVFGFLAWRAVRRGRAGDPDAASRMPWLLLSVFILLVLGALARVADVALRTLH